MKFISKIGYDLDGVFISDLEYNKFDNIETFLDYRADVVRSIFNPSYGGNYYIITGRPASDKGYTEKWLRNNHFSNYRLFHDNKDITKPEQYKKKIINQYNVGIFIESEKRQAQYLRNNCPNCNVVYFGDLIYEAIRNLRENVFPNK